MNLRSLLLPLLVLASACGSSSADEPATSPPPSDSSSDYPLKSLTGSYGVFSDGARTKIFAAVLSGSRFLHVGAGDELVVEIGGARVPLEERIDGERIHLIADIAATKDAEAKVSLVRGDQSIVATTTLAPEFAVKDFPTSMTVGDTVSFDIEPRVDPVKWQHRLVHRIELFGPCIRGGSEIHDLPGNYPLTWNTGQVLPLATGSGCDVEIHVRLDTPSAALEVTPTKEPAVALLEAAHYRVVKAKLVYP